MITNAQFKLLIRQTLTALGICALNNIFYVCSVTGQDNSGYGRNPNTPFATVDAGISACTAAKGDVVICMPGHAETVTATSIALDVSGLTIVGVGNGLNRPVFTFGAAAATITVSAANCQWRNCDFLANFVDVAAAFTLSTAKDFQLVNNTCRDTSSILNFLSIVVTGATANAADGLLVQGNSWKGLAVSPNAFVSILGTIDRLSVLMNTANMAATNNVGHFITFAALVSTNTRIVGNELIVVGATTATVGIFLTGSGTTHTGIVRDNAVSSLDTTSELIATAGTGLAYFNNWYTGTADASGKMWPAVDAA